MTSPMGAQVYTLGFGIRPENVEIPIYSLSNPSQTNINYPIGKRWITPSVEFVLTSFTSANGATLANWSPLGSGLFQINAAGLTPNLSNGSVTVSNAAIKSNSVIIYSVNNLDPNNGLYGIGSVTNGSFTINSSQSAETSNFFYLVVNS